MATAGAGASVDAGREQFLTALLARFEAGAFDAYEYTRRVREIELASSLAAMADIVGRPAPGEPALDAVDLLLMAKAADRIGPDKKQVRFLWPILLGIFLVVLLAVGMWLVGHAKTLQHVGGTGALGAARHAAVAFLS